VRLRGGRRSRRTLESRYPTSGSRIPRCSGEMSLEKLVDKSFALTLDPAGYPSWTLQASHRLSIWLSNRLDELRKPHTVRDVTQTSGKHHIFTMSHLHKQCVDFKSSPIVRSNLIYSCYCHKQVHVLYRHGIERNTASKERRAV
jgi:hypothetical protein